MKDTGHGFKVNDFVRCNIKYIHDTDLTVGKLYKVEYISFFGIKLYSIEDKLFSAFKFELVVNNSHDFIKEI